MKCTIIQKAHLEDQETAILPLFLSRIHAGFPSPADDFMDNRLNINDYIIKNPQATYYVKVSGDSMIGAGIFPGDILVVDRSLPVRDNKIVVAMIEDEFVVKRLRIHKEKLYLISENSQYAPIEVTNIEWMIWGVVSFNIHKPL